MPTIRSLRPYQVNIGVDNRRDNLPAQRSLLQWWVPMSVSTRVDPLKRAVCSRLALARAW
jgi:hypothetical protein